MSGQKNKARRLWAVKVPRTFYYVEETYEEPPASGRSSAVVRLFPKRDDAYFYREQLVEYGALRAGEGVVIPVPLEDTETFLRRGADTAFQVLRRLGCCLRFDISVCSRKWNEHPKSIETYAQVSEVAFAPLGWPPSGWKLSLVSSSKSVSVSGEER